MASSRPFPWTAVLLSVGTLVFVALIGGYLWAMRQVVHAYYAAEYQPTPLDAVTPSVPAKARVADVPWVKQPLGRDAALSLQMLAAQQGKDVPLSHVEFAMGTSWGALGVPRQTSFNPGGDEDVGFRVGAPLLGFTRRYLTTDDAQRYLVELKAQLAKGRAVRVVVDLPTLLKQPPQEEAAPRDLVLVGYDGDELEYYDPVCTKVCDPGERGVAGRKVAAALLLEAEDRQALRFKYPWTYQLLVLEPAGQAGELTSVLERNARALIGFKAGGGGPATGSYVVADVAGVVSKSGRDGFSSPLQAACTLAAQVRADDAAVLRALFPGDDAVELAAKQLELAASAYGRAAKAFEKKDETFGLTDALLAAAAADQEAGAALLTRVQKSHP